MNYTTPPSLHRAQDRFGRLVAARLDLGVQDLPHDIIERLRATRARAVAERKREVGAVAASPLRPLHAVLATAGVAVGPTGGSQEPGWWTRLASVLPVVVLVTGLVMVQGLQADRRAAELAEVDAALLTDDLPPAAYADPGFVQFLKSDH